MISRSTLSSRFVQLAINGCTVVTGFCTFLPLGSVTKYFNQCILYADLSVSVKENMTVTVDVQKSSWGSNCNFATYVPVVAAIHAFIWCWFFLLMKATLKEEKVFLVSKYSLKTQGRCLDLQRTTFRAHNPWTWYREYYLLLPSFLLHSIMVLVVLVNSSIVSAGADSFCRHLTRQLGQKYTCSESFNLHWDVFRDGSKHSIYQFLLVAKIFTWLMTLTILAQCTLTSYKLYRWFVLQHPSQEKASPKKNSSKKKTKMQLPNGSNNGGYMDGSSSDSSDVSLDIDGTNRENAFIHHDETGSLIRVV